MVKKNTTKTQSGETAILRLQPLVTPPKLGTADQKAVIADAKQTGLFDAELVLSQRVYKISESGVVAAISHLDSGDREKLMASLGAILVRNEEITKADDLQTSFPPLRGITHGTGPFKTMVPGALVIIGESRSGKTTWIRRNKPDLSIRISEPLEFDDNDSSTVVLGHFAHAIGLAIAAGLSGRSVAIDSLRGLMYRMKGNTLEGGIAAGLFELLTTLNNLAGSLGTTIIFSVNPMTGDDSKMALLVKRVEASVAGYVFMRNGGVDSLAYRDINGNRISDVIGEESGTLAFTSGQEIDIRDAGAAKVMMHLSMSALDHDGENTMAPTVHTVLRNEPGESDPKPNTMIKLNY